MLIHMKLSISSDIDLDGDKGGYVTWLDVRLSEGTESFGTARIAIVHVGEIADAAGEIWPALQGTKLEPIPRHVLQPGLVQRRLRRRRGHRPSLHRPHQHRRSAPRQNLDLALVRRLCDTLGSGCQLAVVGYNHALEAARWGRLGFAVSTAGRTQGLMHMKLGYRHASVVDTGSGQFEVVANGDSYQPATSLAN